MVLTALREGVSVRAATRAAGRTKAGVYKARKHEAGFRAAWDAAWREGVERKASVRAAGREDDGKAHDFGGRRLREDVRGLMNSVGQSGNALAGMTE